MKPIKASVVILTLNGEKYLDEVLKAVFDQQAAFDFEVIVIDSGSRDQTLKIVKNYPVKLIQISSQEFNHGTTRNLGVKNAQGEFVAFLTQDATPADEHWLAKLVACFEIDSKVGGVFGKHVPRENCDLITRRDIEGVFNSISTNGKPAVQYLGSDEGKKTYEENEGLYRFYSDVNSCLRKCIWEKVPYQKVEYTEDQLFGRDILEKGYMKVYCPEAAVFHSHTFPVRKMLKRFYDEFKGLNIVFGYKDENVNLLNIIPQSTIAAYQEARYIFRQNLSIGQKIYWCWYSFWWHLIRRVAIFLGGRHENLPGFVGNLLSLEYAAKKER